MTAPPLDDLVIRATADISDLTRGFGQGADAVTTFARDVASSTRGLDTVFRDVERAAASMATTTGTDLRRVAQAAIEATRLSQAEARAAAAESGTAVKAVNARAEATRELAAARRALVAASATGSASADDIRAVVAEFTALGRAAGACGMELKRWNTIAEQATGTMGRAAAADTAAMAASVEQIGTAAASAGRDTARLGERLAAETEEAAGSVRALALEFEQLGTGARVAFDQIAARYRDVSTGRFVASATVRPALVDTGSVGPELAQATAAARAMSEASDLLTRDLAEVGASASAAAQGVASAAASIGTLAQASAGTDTFAAALARQLGEAERTAENLAGALSTLNVRARASSGGLVVEADEVARVSAAVRELGTTTTVTAGNFAALRRTLSESLGGARVVDTSALNRQGAEAADALVAGLTRRFQSATINAREELFRGLINRQEYERIGREAAQSFNSGILRGIERLGDRGLLGGGRYERLVGELRDVGLEASRAGERGFGTLTRQSGLWSAQGQRIASASVAVAFGLEALARGGEAADTGLRQALRSVAALAAAFGPQGLIVSGVAASLAAILDMFDRTREEARRTREAFEQEVNGMIRTADSIGLQRRLQTIQFGQPDVKLPNLGEIEAGVFEGSLVALQRAVERYTRERGALLARGIPREPVRLEHGVVIDTPEIRQLQTANRELARLLPQYAARWREYLTIRDAILDPPTLPRNATPLPEVAVSGGVTTPEGRQAIRDASEDLRELEQTARRLIEINRLSESLKVPLPDADQRALNEQLVRVYDEATAALARQADQWGAVALSIRRTIAELEGVDFVRFARRMEAEIRLEPFRVPEPAPVQVRVIPNIDASFDYAAALKLDFDQRILRDLAKVAGGAGEIATAFREAGGDTNRFGREVLSTLNDVERLASAVFTVRDAWKALSVEGGTLGDLGSLLGGITAGIGALQSLGGFVGQMVGDSPGEQAMKAAVDGNTEAMERLRLEIRDAAFGINDRRRVGEAAAAIEARGLSGANVFGNQDLVDRTLRRAASELGVSVAELERAADEFGINLIENGFIVEGAFGDLAEALGYSIDAITRFTNSLEDQQRIRNARREIFDLEGPAAAQAALDDQLALIRRFGPEFYEMFFAGIDTSTEAGRAELEQATREFFARLTGKLGALDPDLFGDLTVEEWLDLLLGADAALDDLADSAKDAAAQLSDLNVPAGFRRAALEFASTMEEASAIASGAAQAASEGGALVEPVALDGLTIAVDDAGKLISAGTNRLADIFEAVLRGGTATPVSDDGWKLLAPVGAARAPAAATSVAFQFGPQSIVIQGASKSGEQLFEEITEAARKKALQSGASAALPFTKIN